MDKLNSKPIITDERERIINTGRSGKRNSEVYNITKRTMGNIYKSCGGTTLRRDIYNSEGSETIASERVTIY